MKLISAGMISAGSVAAAMNGWIISISAGDWLAPKAAPAPANRPQDSIIVEVTANTASSLPASSSGSFTEVSSVSKILLERCSIVPISRYWMIENTISQRK